MEIMSPAYTDGGAMSPRFATRNVPEGGNVSIPLRWGGAPAQTRSYALVVIDHSPVAHEWVHWLVVDIPASATSLAEGVSLTRAMPPGALELSGTKAISGYSGPQPPPGTGRHPYEAKVFALDVEALDVRAGATWPDVETAMRGHVLASASVTGVFGR